MIRKDREGNILRLGEYQEKDGTYQYRWIDENGDSRVNRAEDLDSLRKEITQIHQYLDYGIPTIVMHLTMDQLYKLWLSEKRNLRTRTIQRYQGMYENHISGVLGKIEVRKIRKMDIRHYCESLIEERGLKENTVRNYFRLIYQILEYGVREGYLPENPSKRAWRVSIKEGKGGQQKRKALTVSEQRMILEVLGETPELRRWRPAIQFMLFTGLRVGELEALRWEDIDEERDLLYVSHTMGRKLVGRRFDQPELGSKKRKTTRRNYYRKCLSSPKTGAGERQIPLVNNAKQALIEERLRQQNLGIVCREKIDGYDDYVFLTDEGRLISDSRLNSAIQDLCGRVRQRFPAAFDGLKQVTCHTFRHSFATRMWEAGVQMKVIQDVMGHSDISMTMNVYTEVTVKQMTQELRTLESVRYGFVSGKAE